MNRRPAARTGVWAAGLLLAGAALVPFACTLDAAGLAAGDGVTSTTGGAGGSTATSTTSTAGMGGSGATTGAGGAGGVASGSSGTAGGGGAGGQLPTYAWFAGEPTPAGTYDLPFWLQFASPSAGRTVQTSASTLRGGFPPDVARARNVGAGWGLCVESARTNFAKNAESWTGNAWAAAGMAATANVPDPAGGNAATQFASTGNQRSNVQYLYTLGLIAPITISTWVKGVSGGPPYAHFVFWTESLSVGVSTQVVDAEWRRPSLTGTPAFTMELDTIGGPQQTPIVVPTTLVAYGAQVEAPARYPSSFIANGDGSTTRAAESLSSQSPMDLVPSGWLNVMLAYAPHYASGEQLSAHDLIYFDADNRLTMGGDSTIVLRIGGVELASSALTWGRDQVLTIVAKSSAGGRELTVVGATAGDGTVTAAPATPIPAVPALYVLGQPAGAQEGSDLRSVEFFE